MNSEQEYQAFLDGRTSLRAIQEELLTGMFQRNADCAYGQRLGFEKLASIADYQRLPLIRYETLAESDADFWSDPANYSTERTLAYFLTSGSTAAPKKIPVTPSLVRQKARAFGTFWGSIYSAHPALESGNFIANFADAGHAERDANGIQMLSETTFWNQRMQGLQDPKRWPVGKQVADVASAADRYYVVARLALQSPLHCLMTLNPSTIVQFCQTITAHGDALAHGLGSGNWGLERLDDQNIVPEPLTARLRSDRDRANDVISILGSENESWQLKALWPEMELLISWQSDLVEPYLRLLKKHSEGIARRDYITQSSECIMAIPISDDVSGGPLAYKSHFFEFIPEEETESKQPATLLAWQLERDRRYELVVSTGGGLYRYRMGDCVIVNDFLDDVPIIEFKYRLGKTSSMTGEKLTEVHVLEALRATNRSQAETLDDILVFPSTTEIPHYAVLVPAQDVETGQGDDTELREWLMTFDRELGRANPEYSDKRESMRLATPRILRIRQGDFEMVKRRFRAAHTGDDQYKPSPFSNKRDLDDGIEILRAIHEN